MFTKLTPEQIQSKLTFIENYKKSRNPADGSHVDSNANVESKNVATLASEIPKDIFIQIKRTMMFQKISQMFDFSTAAKFRIDLESKEIYIHDESSAPGIPYCMSISLYPFLLNGTKEINGISKKPEHLDSFCGSFVNLVFAISSQIAGAVGTPELLLAFNHFAEKDFGENYLETHSKIIENRLQEIIYCLNQPATARGFQSIFHNISLFDSFFLKGMFEHFVFPDGSKPNFSNLMKLQKFFLSWFRKERLRALLTFPVVTACLKSNEAETKPEDEDFWNYCAEEMSFGSSFFVYQSPSVDSISSCCRLQLKMSDNTFSSTLGCVGVMTGSIQVITLNMNRIIQNQYFIYKHTDKSEPFLKFLKKNLQEKLQNIHKYQVAFREIIKDFDKSGLLPIYSAGFMDISRQFSTIGINGMTEGCEFLGMIASNNDEYKYFLIDILKTIQEQNAESAEKYRCKFNCEFVPAENLGYKNAINDKRDGLFSPREIYNSYFYPSESQDVNILDKFILQGRELNKYLDGGSALHLNLQEHLSKSQYMKLFEIAAKTGCRYWCVNVKMTICNDCNHIDYKTLHKCPKCSSENIDWATRIIGYLKRISSFSTPRQKEEGIRYYHKGE